MEIKKELSISAFCVLFWMLCSCHHEALPAGVMDEEKMADFLQQAYLLEGFYSVETQYRYDTLQPEIIASYDSLFSEYGITRKQFERSVDWYAKHPEDYTRIHDTVIARLERMD